MFSDSITKIYRTTRAETIARIKVRVLPAFLICTGRLCKLYVLVQLFSGNQFHFYIYHLISN